MNKLSRQLLLSVTLACFGTLTLTGLAQTPPSASPDTEAVPAASVATPSSPAVAAPDSTAAVSTAPAATPEPRTAVQAPAAPAAPSTPATESDSSLRRLDAPAAEAATPDAPAAPAAKRSRHGQATPPRVSIFNNASLAQGEAAEAVVAVLGNATSDGTVNQSVVAVLGNARATGPVGDSVVAVGGNAYVNNRVREVVAVGGNVELGPNAVVRDGVTCVGGRVIRDPAAIVHGATQNVRIAPFDLGDSQGLQAYLNQCVLRARPLAFGAHLAWAWCIALGFLFLYVVLALLFRGGIERTVQTLETRPGGSVLTALLTVLLTPVLCILLITTVAGIAVVPFLAIGLLCASLFGKATMLAWIGRRITKLFGDGPLAHPAFAVLIGGVIVLALYVVPVAGFIVYKLLGFVGLGAVVYTLLLAARRNRKPRVAPVAPAPVTPPVVPPVAPVVVAPAARDAEAGFAASGAGSASAVVAEQVASPAEAAGPAVPPTVLPVAGFWIRLAALALDVILVWILLAFVCSMFPHSLHLHSFNLLLPALATYGAILWKLRGTTIGGIICGLRVVRVDGRELDWATTIVRALSCFLSLVVVGLGFIWTAIDEEKQSWHDKIAGTTVVFARNGQSLV